MLIVDRHPPVRLSMRDLVATLGVTAIHMAESSHAAKRHVGGQKFDVILCDYLLEAHKDGQQLLEELRHTGAIPLSTIFMIVTGERAYQSVVSVAELAPDDYLIKPFTPEHLAQRLLKALEKKHAFRIAHGLVHAGKPREAAEECERIGRSHSRYLLDALRLKAQLLVALKETQQAEELYRRILEFKCVPWARMGLAWVLHQQGELDAAEAAASAVIDEKPEYLSAYTFLARVQEAKGEVAAALGTLDRAVAHSPNNVARLRKLGELAVGARELDRARRAFDKVLERASDSDILKPEDFANVVRVAVEQGAIGDTEKYIQTLRRRFRGRPDGAFVADLLDSVCLAKRGQHASARASLIRALDCAQALGETVSPQLMMDLAESCLAHDLPESARALLDKAAASGVALRPGLAEALNPHGRKVEIEPVATAPADSDSQPTGSSAAAAMDSGAGDDVLATESAAVPDVPPPDPDRFELSELPAQVRPMVAVSNSAERNFEAAGGAAAQMLALFRQGVAGSPNDHACMRAVLKRMFLAHPRHPDTVLCHREYAALKERAAAPA